MRTVFARQESIYSRFSSIMKKPMKVCSKSEKKKIKNNNEAKVHSINKVAPNTWHL